MVAHKGQTISNCHNKNAKATTWQQKLQHMQMPHWLWLLCCSFCIHVTAFIFVSFRLHSCCGFNKSSDIYQPSYNHLCWTTCRKKLEQSSDSESLFHWSFGAVVLSVDCLSHWIVLFRDNKARLSLTSNSDIQNKWNIESSLDKRTGIKAPNNNTKCGCTKDNT